MRRTSLLTILVFVAGLCIGYFARGSMGTAHRTDTHAADLAAIEKLHRADIEATLTQDSNQLINLWSDDCVKLGVPGPAIVGKEGIQEVYQKFRAHHPDFKVLKYVPEIQDVQVADGWAIEWVYYEATFKMSAKDNPVSTRRKDLRVLKRQSDGSWKFSREAETDWGKSNTLVLGARCPVIRLIVQVVPSLLVLGGMSRSSIVYLFGTL